MCQVPSYARNRSCTVESCVAFAAAVAAEAAGEGEAAAAPRRDLRGVDRRRAPDAKVLPLLLGAHTEASTPPGPQHEALSQVVQVVPGRRGRQRGAQQQGRVRHPQVAVPVPVGIHEGVGRPLVSANVACVQHAHAASRAVVPVLALCVVLLHLTAQLARYLCARHATPAVTHAVRAYKDVGLVRVTRLAPLQQLVQRAAQLLATRQRAQRHRLGVPGEQAGRAVGVDPEALVLRRLVRRRPLRTRRVRIPRFRVRGKLLVTAREPDAEPLERATGPRPARQLRVQGAHGIDVRGPRGIGARLCLGHHHDVRTVLGHRACERREVVRRRRHLAAVV